MISGDLHLMAYDNGGHASNPFGDFPIFQCAPMDKRPSCLQGITYSNHPTFYNGQYCLFEYRLQDGHDHCLKFSGFSHDSKLMEFDTCLNSKDRHQQNMKKQDQAFRIQQYISEQKTELKELLIEHDLTQFQDNLSALEVQPRDPAALKQAKLDAQRLERSIEVYYSYLDHLEEISYGGVTFNCPIKAKDKAKGAILFFYVFYVLILFYNVARRCCPKRIE